MSTRHLTVTGCGDCPWQRPWGRGAYQCSHALAPSYADTTGRPPTWCPLREGAVTVALEEPKTLGQVAYEAFRSGYPRSHNMPEWSELSAAACDDWTRIAGSVVAEHERRKGAR